MDETIILLQLPQRCRNVTATSMKMHAIVLSPRDNVATALTDLRAGQSAVTAVGPKTATIRTRTRISLGHKFAIQPIPRGARVVKYGEVIGHATRSIGIGDHVHVQNVESRRGRGDLTRRKGARR